MITIGEHAPRPAQELIERYLRASAAAAGHVLEFGLADPALRPLLSGCKIAGPALTVRTNGLDSAVVHIALDLAEEGDVLVLDVSGDQRHANWGEMTSLAAKRTGVAAAIIDGALTDLAAVRTMGFQVYHRCVSALTSRGPGESGEINTVVHCAGVVVSPGDIVLGDEDGVLFVPSGRAEAVLAEVCEPREAREVWMRAQLASGRALSELSGAAGRVAAHRTPG